MYAADPSALVEKAKKTAVDLTKHIHLDVVYSELMDRKPRTPKFEEDPECPED